MAAQQTLLAAATDAAVMANLRRALAEVAGDPALADVRGELMLDGFETLPEDAYEAILTLERDAVAQGYPTLA